MKKGIFSALLVALLALTFSFTFGCKKADTPKEEAVTEEKAPVEEAKEEAKTEAKDEKTTK